MKAKINLPNIKSFIQGNWRAALLEYYPDGLDTHIEEQYYWRIQQVAEKSPECLENKECKKCHCSIPELFMADKACENSPSCYPEMMNEEQWNKFNLPGIEGTKFKIKLSKNHFSGNMTPEQIEDIARDLGFYDSGNIKPLENKE